MSPAPRGGNGRRKKTPARKAPGRKTPARKPRATGKRPPPTPAEPQPGSTVGSYLIEEPIARGGMGIVFRARDQRAATMGRPVALKVLPPSLAADDRFRRRFERESQMAASLDHPNIVPVFEAGEDGGVLYIAMRHVEGQDLHRLLERDGPLAPERALAILGQVASALDAAHARGLVHRDVKPANILVVGGEDQAEPHVYLTDFGVTKHTTSRSGLTATGQFVGTVEYVAPEQIEGRQVDGRADVYSLGCVLFQCVTGTAPFAREQEAATLWAHLSDAVPSASERRAGLPPELDAAIARAMAKSPDDRFSTCHELIEAARAAPAAASAAPTPPPPPAPPAPETLTPPGGSAPPPATPAPGYGPPPTPAVPGRRRGLPAGAVVAIAAGAVAIVALIAILVTMGGDGPQPEDPFPNAAERQLLDRIPQELRTPPCTRADQTVVGAAASVDCFTDTPQLLTYSLFPDDGAMNAAYDRRLADAGVTPEAGDCAAGESAEDSWLDPGGATTGRLLCFTGSTGSPTIVWTHGDELILAEASRPGGDAAALYEFWTGIADHATGGG